MPDTSVAHNAPSAVHVWKREENAFLKWVLVPLLLAQVVFLSYFEQTASRTLSVLVNGGPTLVLFLYMGRVLVTFYREKAGHLKAASA